MKIGLYTGIIWTQYVNDGLKKIAANLLGGAQLSDAQKLVVINSARLWNPSVGSWEPCALSNATNNPYRDTLMQDAALATSAAPTYFPPYEVGNFGFFADGGVFANNPAITAISEALSSGAVKDQSQLRVLSLGTGLVSQGIPSGQIPKPLNWGATHWLWPRQQKTIPAMALLSLTMDATAQVADANASKMLGSNYCRGNFTLHKPFGLDDWKNVSELIQWTQKYLITAEWSEVKKWVTENW